MESFFLEKKSHSSRKLWNSSVCVSFYDSIVPLTSYLIPSDPTSSKLVKNIPTRIHQSSTGNPVG